MARAFFVIGGLAFGGQSGLLALLNRDLAERRRWLAPADIAEAFTYVQLLPGPVVAQVVAYLGWKLRGARGTVVATVAFLAPSVLVMIGVGAAYKSIAHASGVRAALGGLTAAVVGLIVVAIAKQGAKTLRDPLAVVVAVCALGAIYRWGVNPALLVAVGGGLGIVREALRKTPPADAPKPTSDDAATP